MITTKPLLCIGCRTCELVCTIKHFDVNNPKKARIRIEQGFPKPGQYIIKVCKQCAKPKCVDVCGPGALYKEGKSVKFDGSKCTLCKKCIGACPFDSVFFHKDVGILKCDECGACVEICPRKALELR